MSEHRINMTANFSQYDQAIKNAIKNMRFFGDIAERAGSRGNVASDKFAKSLQKLDSEAVTTRQRLATMNTLLKEMEMQYNRLGTAARNSAFGTELNRAIDIAREKVHAYNEELNAVGASVYGGGNGNGAFGAIFGGNLAARAAMDSLRMLKNVVKEAVKDNMEFEYSNATLAAVLGKTKEEIADLTNLARKLGSTSLYSANQISHLQIELARLGFNQIEIEDSTDAIAKLALATGVELSKAASLTGATLRAFGYDTKEAARVASVLGVSTTKSALDMQKLSVALGYASSVSKQAGLDIEDTVAVLGKLVDRGIQATTAGVGIRNIFMDLGDKSSKLSRTIKEVTGKEHIRSLDEFITALNQLKDAGMSMDDVANIIQRRVTPSFLNMLASTKGITELRDELRGCEHELDVMAKKMENTLQGSLTKTKNAWNALMLSFENSNGTFKQVSDDLRILINNLAKIKNLRNGGSFAIAMYEKGANISNYNNTIRTNDKLIKSGVNTVDQIISFQTERLEQKVKARDRFMKLYSYVEGMRDNEDLEDGEKNVEVLKLFNKKGSVFKNRKFLYGKGTGSAFDKLAQLIAEYNDDIATVEKIIAYYMPSGSEDINLSEEGLGIDLNKSTAKSPAESAAEKIADAEQDYAQAVAKAAMDFESGKTDYVGYMEQLYNGSERLYQAYMDAANIVGDDRYKNAMESLRASTIALGQTITETKNNIKAEGQAAKALSDEQKAIRKIDNHTYQQLYNVARDARSQRANFEESAKLIELLKPFKEKMNGDLTLDIPDEVWLEFVKKIMNPMLEKMVLPQIELDAASGNVTKLKNGKIGNQSAYTGSVMDLAGNAVGAISSITTNLETLGVNISDQFKEGLNKLTAVVNIAQTIAAIVSTIQSIQVAMMIKGFIPFLHTGGMVHAAQGVFVPGNMREGVDTVPAMLSPGELVLNHAQQSNLAAQLQGLGSMRNARLVTKVSGGDILIALDNTNRSRGGSRGTYAYSK